jgi:hypothetical protein
VLREVYLDGTGSGVVHYSIVIRVLFFFFYTLFLRGICKYLSYVQPLNNIGKNKKLNQAMCSCQLN